MNSNPALLIIIGIVIVGGFFLTGGLFNYQYTNQNIPGAFVPLSPSPDNSQKSIQFHAFKFLYLTPTPTPNVGDLGGPGSGSLPNSNTCGGYYSLNSPSHLNFGDPQCEFIPSKIAATKNQLYQLLQAIDPTHVNFWFFKIMPCESGYNPNAYNPNSQSGKGAYGLVQMNPFPIGNNKYDAGNVFWQNQMKNAVAYNHLIGDSFAYWACAR